MNHHLRFDQMLGLAVSSLAAVFATSSCSSNSPGQSVPPVVAVPDKDITYEVRVYQIDDDHPLAGKRFSMPETKVGNAMIASFDRPPDFISTVGIDYGENKATSNKKDFLYPTEWKPAEFPPPNQRSGIVGGSEKVSSFPVTPATPKKFKTTQVGTTLKITAAKTNRDFDFLISRKILLGFVNYGKPITAPATDFFGREVEIVITENRIELPNFGVGGAEIGGGMPPNQMWVIPGKLAETHPPNGKPYESSGRKNFLVFVRQAWPAMAN